MIEENIKKHIGKETNMIPPLIPATFNVLAYYLLKNYVFHRNRHQPM